MYLFWVSCPPHEYISQECVTNSLGPLLTHCICIQLQSVIYLSYPRLKPWRIRVKLLAVPHWPAIGKSLPLAVPFQIKWAPFEGSREAASPHSLPTWQNLYIGQSRCGRYSLRPEHHTLLLFLPDIQQILQTVKSFLDCLCL